jgi:hypothetical protein
MLETHLTDFMTLGDFGIYPPLMSDLRICTNPEFTLSTSALIAPEKIQFSEGSPTRMSQGFGNTYQREIPSTARLIAKPQ